MEVVTGLSIKDIFQHNNNWQNFEEKHRPNLREAIVSNVEKMMSCRTKALGYHC